MTNLDQFEDGIFNVWQPDSVGLLKAEEGRPVDKSWRIGGFASTGMLDRQNERVEQEGLDFSEFVQFGWFNDNHQQHTSAAIGVPELAEYRKSKGWWTEGYLLQDVPRAIEVHTLAKALQGSGRMLGFSIEGKILERYGNKIVKALVRNVAITNSPVNTSCSWDLVSKSWASDLEMKALAAGHVRGEGGRVLIPEDLEKDEIKYVYRCPTCRKAFSSTGGLEEHVEKSHQSHSPKLDDYPAAQIRRVAKSYTREEALDFLRRVRPDYSEDVRVRLVDFVFKG